MAQLLLIKKESLSFTDNRAAGDIVGVFHDKHVFSAHEQKIFNIVSVKGTREEIEAQIQHEDEVVLNNAEEWDLLKYKTADQIKTLDSAKEQLEIKQVWKTATGDYKEIKVKPRFQARYEDAQIKENFSRHTENTETVLVTAATALLTEAAYISAKETK